jgi:capsular polysaccharide biosynthesis protein
MVEIVPRIALYLDFLKANPQIRILAPETGNGRLADLFRILGLDPWRLVAGLSRAKIVYQPRAVGCGRAIVPETQILSNIYRKYISRSFPLGESTSYQNRLILIRRSGSRRFTEQAAIEVVVRQAASDFNLTYSLFIDNPTPSLSQTMFWFNTAAVVVAPHGAGLANIIFSEPGTFILEGMCDPPHTNVCFQRLAYVLGHHWHGVMSKGGCEGVVDVAAATIDVAVRKILRLWTKQHQHKPCPAHSLPVKNITAAR